MKCIQVFLFVAVLIFSCITYVDAENLQVYDSPNRTSEAENSHTIPCSKRYIPIDKIAFVKNAILIEIEGMIIETPAIYSDDFGLYIQQVKISGNRCSTFEWECLKCGYCNFALERCCLVCEHDRTGHRCK